MRPDILNFLFTPIDRIKGIGEKSLEKYQKLLTKRKKFIQDFQNPVFFDLLYHLPERILYRKKVDDIQNISAGDYIIAKVKVIAHSPPFKKNSPYKFTCYLGKSFVSIIFYKVYENYIKNKFKIDSEIIISGKTEIFDNNIQIVQPDYILNLHEENKIPIFEPIYPLTFGLSNKEINNNINEIIYKIPDLPEWILKETIEKYNWLTWKESLINLHKPSNNFDLKNNKFLKRLAFDELLAKQLALEIMKNNIIKNTEKTLLINNTKNLKDFFIKNKLLFELTIDQKNAIEEIEKDTFSNKKMMRLLQGDVGSGKTIVAFLTALNYVENNKQVALMVPTSILATQHYENLTKLCDNTNVKLELLTSQTKSSKKKQIIENLQNGSINLLIGTHALIEEDIIFNDLGFIIIDEQQRFGVEQRLLLIKKNKNIDILSMSATPIPRTLALTIYNDMDLSIIKEKPINRKEIKTTILNINKYEELIKSIEKKIHTNEKILWVCPLIEENEKLDLIDVKARFDNLANIFGNEKVSFIHGKMKEKDSIMEDFIRNDNKKILIATTVVEIGIDIKYATIIIIEHPERFGLSQLHQLRGRVGRNDLQSYCILLYDNKNIGQKSLKRLEIMKKTNDGFVIAEEDLKLRGIGELVGLKQSGAEDYLLADLDRDYELLLETCNLSKQIVKNNEVKKYLILLYLFGYVGLLNRELLN